MPNVKISGNNRVRKSREATSIVKIFLYFLHSEPELGSRGTAVGYKIFPAEVRKGPTLPGFFRLPTLCGVFLNTLDRPSFHITIQTSPIMSFSIHLPDCSKCSLNSAIDRFSAVIDYSPNLFQTSSSHDRLYSELSPNFVNGRISPTVGLL